MSAAVKLLTKRILTPSGKPRRGALSRVSEHLGVSHPTLRRWIAGEWEPGKATCEKIWQMLRDKGFDYSARKTGPKNGAQ